MVCSVVFSADKVPLFSACGLPDASDSVGYAYIKSSVIVVDVAQYDSAVCVECDLVDVCVELFCD